MKIDTWSKPCGHKVHLGYGLTSASRANNSQTWPFHTAARPILGVKISFSLFWYNSTRKQFRGILYNSKSWPKRPQPPFDLILHIFYIFWRQITSIERNLQQIEYEDWRFTIRFQDSSQECRVFLLINYFLFLGDVIQFFLCNLDKIMPYYVLFHTAWMMNIISC